MNTARDQWNELLNESAKRKMERQIGIEIRAAELYAMGRDVFLKATIGELRGWFDHAFGDFGPDDGPIGENEAWHAGWLARQMFVS